METISSATFRKTYSTLRRPFVVTALGRPIGYWVPVIAMEALPAEVARLASGWDQAIHEAIRTGTGPLAEPLNAIEQRRTSQAERDAILRRINKGS